MVLYPIRLRDMNREIYWSYCEKLTFKTEAAEEDSSTGSSLHKSCVIDPVKFMEKA